MLCYQDTRLSVTFAQRAYDQAEHTCADDHDMALARLSLGWATTHNGDDPAAAISHLQESAGEFRRLADDWHYALALEGIGHSHPDPDLALAHLRQSADLFGQMHDHVKQANCLNEMARRSIDVRAHLSEASQWLSEARRLADLTGNETERLHAEILQARLDQCRGDHQLAQPRFERLLTELRRVGDRRCMSRCLLGLAHAALHHNDHETARHHLAECITVADVAGDTLGMADGLRLLAKCCHATGDSGYAASLLGAADDAAAHLDPARRHALPFDHEFRVTLEKELGADAFASALTAGQQTPLTQLLAR